MIFHEPDCSLWRHLFLIIWGGYHIDADASVTVVPFETIKGAQDVIAPHRAIYDIKMTSMKRGSQILGGRNYDVYAGKSVCGGWITDHNFNMVYE